MLALASLVVVTSLCAAPPPIAKGKAAKGEAAEVEAVERRLTLETGRHVAAIRRTAVDARGSVVLSASDDGTARLWRASDGELLRVLRPPFTGGQPTPLRAAALSPDGQLAVVGWRGCLHAFDANTGVRVRGYCHLAGPVEDAAISPDGRHLAMVHRDGAGLTVVDVKTGALVGRDAAYGHHSYGVAFAPDGRLATTCFDGFLRLYAPGDYRPLARVGGKGARPYGLAFDARGERLAVGYEDRVYVEVRRGSDLEEPVPVHLGGLTAPITSVAFLPVSPASVAGGGLVGGGLATDGVAHPVLYWDDVQAPPTKSVRRAFNTVMDIAALPVSSDRPVGGVAVASFDPSLGVVDASGEVRWWQGSGAGDFRGNQEDFRVDPSGRVVELFVLPPPQRTPPRDTRTRFSVERRMRSLAGGSRPGEAAGFAPPFDDDGRLLTPPLVTAGGLLPTGWQKQRPSLFLGPTRLPLDLGERALAVAVEPDGSGFTLGADWNLRYFDRHGSERWKTPVPGPAWAVQRTDRGLVLAALGDGTLRWYRADDGRELLALYLVPGAQDWVLFTPSGFWDASPGGAELLGWVYGRGADKEAAFHPVARFADENRQPAIIDGVLSFRDEAEAVRAAHRRGGASDLSNSTGGAAPPVVRILAPTDGAQVPPGTGRGSAGSPRPADELEVRVSVDGGGLPLLSLEARMDGRPLPRSRGFQKAPARSDVHSLRIPWPDSDVSLTVVAKTAAGVGLSEPVELRLPAAAPPPRAGRVLALTLGVSAYTDPRLRLRLAAKDARDVGQALRTLQGRPWRDVVVKELLDEEVTPASVAEAVRWLADTATPDDVVVVFAAGHGTHDEGGVYRFLPAAVVPQDLAATGIDLGRLGHELGRIPAPTLVLLDTCHAGDALGPPGERTRSDGTAQELAGVDAGLRVLAASTGRQVSFEDTRWQHGAFTAALLEGLSGKASLLGDGRVTVGMLEVYVSERVRTLTSGRQTPAVAKPVSVADITLVDVGPERRR